MVFLYFPLFYSFSNLQYDLKNTPHQELTLEWCVQYYTYSQNTFPRCILAQMCLHRENPRVAIVENLQEETIYNNLEGK